MHTFDITGYTQYTYIWIKKLILFLPSCESGEKSLLEACFSTCLKGRTNIFYVFQQCTYIVYLFRLLYVNIIMTRTVL